MKTWMTAAIVVVAMGLAFDVHAQTPVPYEPGARCVTGLDLPARYACDARIPTDEGTFSTLGCVEISEGASIGTFVMGFEQPGGGFQDVVCACHPGGDGADEDGDPFAESAATNAFACHSVGFAASGAFRSNGRLIPNAVLVGEALPFIVSIRCRLGPCTTPPPP